MKEVNKLINLGTKETPEMVPVSALRPETTEGKEYFEMLAGGSVVLEHSTLDKLIKLVNEQDTTKG